jgi:hypothetical protein
MRFPTFDTRLSTIDTRKLMIPIDMEQNDLPAASQIVQRVWASVERTLVRLGDRLNPILVKETRQALKSRQFLLTFTLVLFLAWGWSILGIALIGPGASVGAYGGEMFLGYFIILALPLIVIVPFGAYRSLTAEQETRTYELLSITALGPRQIVAGKLGSAVVQMSVYLSAVSPCLAFTYLLRGLDFLTILYFLGGITLASLGASAIGLLLATITPRNQFQVVPMVAAVLGLFLGFIFLIMGAVAFFEEGASSQFADWAFWLANAAVLTVFAAYFLLVCEAAAARLSFASDNRSSRLRAIMVLHFLLITGWIAVFWKLDPAYPDAVLVFMILAGLHWYIMGALMIGESPRLSSRVKRHLPQSFLGRMFLTWFYPGPGTGYMLALCGLTCTLLIVGIGMAAWRASGIAMHRLSRAPSLNMPLTFSVLSLSYVAIYLGLGLLLLRALRRVTSAGLLLSVLLQVLLPLFGSLVPLIIQLTSPELRHTGFSLMQISNPFWTLAEVGGRSALPAETPYLLAFVPLAAVGIFALNLPGLIREIRNIRIAKPRRVAEEDAALRPRGKQKDHKPQESPFA